VRLSAPAAPGSATLQGRVGPPQFPRPPSIHPTPPTPGGSSAPAPPGLRRLPWPSPSIQRLGSPLSPFRASLTGLQDSLHAAGWMVASPLSRVSSLRFCTRDSSLTQAACYRASWQLPGPDFRRLAYASLCVVSSYPPFFKVSGSCPRSGHTNRSTSLDQLQSVVHTAGCFSPRLRGKTANGGDFHPRDRLRCLRIGDQDRRHESAPQGAPCWGSTKRPSGRAR